MVSERLTRRVPQAWQAALLGMLASLPATAVVNWLPNSEATIGGGVMVIGAMIAGAVAAGRSINPTAAGLRAGFLGGVIGVLAFVVTVGMTATWSATRIVFFTFAGVMVLSIAPVFGLVFGWIGGWVANVVSA